jgi:hypothetical protein
MSKGSMVGFQLQLQFPFQKDPLGLSALSTAVNNFCCISFNKPQNISNLADIHISK